MTPFMRTTMAAICYIGFAPLAGQADPVAVPFTYEQFEASVSHLDLERCPEGLPQSNTFCRASIHHEEFHVFAFSEDGDIPMVGFATFSADGVNTILK